MLRAVSSNLRPDHWTFEVETLAVLDMAGFLFSFGLRLFLGFGLLVRCPSRMHCHARGLGGPFLETPCRSANPDSSKVNAMSARSQEGRL